MFRIFLVFNWNKTGNTKNYAADETNKIYNKAIAIRIN